MRNDWLRIIGAGLVSIAFGGSPTLLRAASQDAAGELLTKEGTVDFSRLNTNWVPARIGLKMQVQDRLRTRALSRATLQLTELGRLRVNELTTLEILPPKAATSKTTLDLKGGALYFFTRDKPREFLLQTPSAVGASRGTEFLATVDAAGATVLTVFDGEVELTNAQGAIVLTNGEQGTVQVGQKPMKTAVIQATNIVQWWIYYPGVLDPDELQLTPAERTALAASLSSYSGGDLLNAVASYPTGRVPQSIGERLFYAGLLLAVGQVEQAETLLDANGNESQPAFALRQIIASVRSGKASLNPKPALATEWLAQSYALQTTNLAAALRSARAAADLSPQFGFAWERVAELEFSFGHVGEAKVALEKSLELSPRNAQGLALKGFVLSAENHIEAARQAFEEAIQADGALGNGWLGRGLCRIRTGDAAGGRNDLQTAATLESKRSLLRSYLGKAFSNVYDQRHARQELDLARRLDANDPTAWLYSALLNQQDNRLNEGVGDLETSLLLNDNRRVYRSELLLDQDRAVRSASLATIYQNAGMDQVAIREAARAVSYDYGNYSAHLFLANSLSAQLDPTRFNVRYESASIDELLLANLLAPAGAGTLSQNISQQEYSKLFEANRLGFAADTSWRSDGQFHEFASQFGIFGNTSYSLDVEYQHNDGVRPNNQFERTVGQLALKQQITANDSLFFATVFEDIHSGDNFQYYDPVKESRPYYHLDQTQDVPTFLAGYHHEWSPGVHTLLLGSRLTANQQFSDQDATLNVLTPGQINRLGAFPFDIKYNNELNVYGAEINQIFQGEHQNFVVGARCQAGDIGATDYLVPTNAASEILFMPPNHQIQEGFQRFVGYGYYTALLPGNLLLTGGVACDTIEYPKNFQDFPITPGQTSRSQVGPKGALIWSPTPEVTLRGAYAQALGGVSIDQSFRLEPVQLAGFNQTFRNIEPPQAGAPSAPEFEIYGGALDLKFKTRTYIGIQGQVLDSEMDKSVGIYENMGAFPFPATNTLQRLKYTEPTILVTINQLVGDNWSLGIQYQFMRSHLTFQFPEISEPAVFVAYPNQNVRSDLHQLTPYVLYNHRSGFFGRVEAPWYSQQNSGYVNGLPGDQFVQVNLFVGYRFPRQFGELSFGLLNLTGTDYHLNPLNFYAELPRERVWMVRLKLSL